MKQIPQKLWEQILFTLEFVQATESNGYKWPRNGKQLHLKNGGIWQITNFPEMPETTRDQKQHLRKLSSVGINVISYY